MDLLQTLVNEIKTPEDYFSTCAMVQHHIHAGREVDSGLVLSLAVKGHGILAPHFRVSQEFMAVFTTEPRGTLDHNNS